MNENEEKQAQGLTQVSECMFMKLPKCKLQDITRRLDMSICLACIAGRSERHLLEIKKALQSPPRSGRD